MLGGLGVAAAQERVKLFVRVATHELNKSLLQRGFQMIAMTELIQINEVQTIARCCARQRNFICSQARGSR